MSTKFTTSAQKTLKISKDAILKTLENVMMKETGLTFEETKNKNIKAAKLKDGSKLIIAGFDKANGKTLAMIDHKDIPGINSRSEIQKSLREKLDRIFK